MRKNYRPITYLPRAYKITGIVKFIECKDIFSLENDDAIIENCRPKQENLSMT